MNRDAMRAELLQLVTQRAVRFGDFVLTSGRRSNYYVDGKQVTLDARGLFLVASLALERCRELGITAVGGLTLGADPIAAAVAALSGQSSKPIAAFIVRKEVKPHGTARAVEGPPLHSGSRVMLVDDTLTTGGTFLQAHERVRETGAMTMEALCVVDREEGGAETLAAAGIPLFALFRRSEFTAPDAALPPSASRV
jgi:orotate phosphoribosyltransferase